MKSLAFFFTGTFLEAGVGPAVITGGFHAGTMRAATTVAGAVLIVFGLAAVAWCYAGLGQAGGTPSPLAPPPALAARGAYGVVRNPMYVATALVIAGEGVLLARPVLLICAAAYLAAMVTLVLRVEEPLLARRHGSAWDAYRAAVPGWLPRPVTKR